MQLPLFYTKDLLSKLFFLNNKFGSMHLRKGYGELETFCESTS